MIIGIDPGFTGAIAFLQSDNILVKDLPITIIKGKKQIDAKLFDKLIKEYSPYDIIKYAAVEDVHAMPKQGVVSTFSFGYNAGILLGVLAANNVTVIKVSPGVWKPALGLSRNKKDSLALAKKLFPSYQHYFRLIKHDGRAEAALIAHFARESL